MPDISATDAARSFSEVLDSVEHDKSRYTIIRRGKAVDSRFGLVGMRATLR